MPSWCKPARSRLLPSRWSPDDNDAWDKLSDGGEQQHSNDCRVMLRQPRWIFLPTEIHSALDETAEKPYCDRLKAQVVGARDGMVNQLYRPGVAAFLTGCGRWCPADVAARYNSAWLRCAG
jgi:hypothetical protein